MSTFWKVLHIGAKATISEFEPGNFQVDNKKIECPHCGNDKFARSSAQLNSTGMTFVGLDWADRSATTLACTQCGRIEWFLRRPEKY